MTAQSSHWQHAIYTHFTELAFPRELPRAHGDAITASLDSTGREDEVLRSLRLTAVLRTLDSRSPSPLHVVKLQANCKPAFFFYMWVTPVNSGVRNWSHKPKKTTNQNGQIWMIQTIQCGNLSWWLWRVWRQLQFPFTSSALLQCIVKQHCGVTTVSGTQQCGGQTERLSLMLRYLGMEMLVPD